MQTPEQSKKPAICKCCGEEPQAPYQAVRIRLWLFASSSKELFEQAAWETGRGARFRIMKPSPHPLQQWMLLSVP